MHIHEVHLCCFALVCVCNTVSHAGYICILFNSSNYNDLCNFSAYQNVFGCFTGSYRPWKVLEFYCLEFQALESPGKGIGPGRSWKVL